MTAFDVNDDTALCFMCGIPVAGDDIVCSACTLMTTKPKATDFTDRRAARRAEAKRRAILNRRQHTNWR